MKGRYFLILMVFFSFYIWYPGHLSGNTYPGEQESFVSFRLFTGLNLAKIRHHWGDPEMAGDEALMAPYHKHRLGVCAGLGMETKGRVGVVVEILYNQKGDRIDFDDGIDRVFGYAGVSEKLKKENRCQRLVASFAKCQVSTCSV